MERPSLSQPLLIERDGSVLTFTLNRPEAGNEVNGPMFEAMMAALRSEAEKPTARVLHLRAAGDVFCLGRERSGRDAVSVRAEVARLIELKRLLRETPLISVAQVQGNAQGFGFGIAILCDFTLVSATASLGFPEMRKGLPPAAIMAYLGRYGLPKRLFPMVLFGQPVSPEDALQAGLITRIVAPESLDDETGALITRLTDLDEIGARQCKAFFLAAQESSIEHNFRHATDMLTVTSLRLMQGR